MLAQAAEAALAILLVRWSCKETQFGDAEIRTIDCLLLDDDHRMLIA